MSECILENEVDDYFADYDKDFIDEEYIKDEDEEGAFIYGKLHEKDEQQFDLGADDSDDYVEKHRDVDVVDFEKKEGRIIYCPECSKISGTDKPVYHLPPICSSKEEEHKCDDDYRQVSNKNVDGDIEDGGF